MYIYYIFVCHNHINDNSYKNNMIPIFSSIFFAIFAPVSANSGVNAIDKATVVNNILHNLGDIIPVFSAIENATNASSPPWAFNNPMYI